MLAWMSQEAFDKTLETGEAHYWSRSRQELWHKGATSGSIQIVKELRIDCDQDALVMLIDQKNTGACHTGRQSCFYRIIGKNGTLAFKKEL
jgi:phosphoribosyl-AMP cyclohydrolase